MNFMQVDVSVSKALATPLNRLSFLPFLRSFKAAVWNSRGSTRLYAMP